MIDIKVIVEKYYVIVFGLFVVYVLLGCKIVLIYFGISKGIVLKILNVVLDFLIILGSFNFLFFEVVY